MAISLQDLNFGYTGTTTPTLPAGDAALAALLQDPAALQKQYASSLKSFSPWWGTTTKGKSSADVSKLWNDLVGDFGESYKKSSGQEFTPSKQSVQDFVSALGALTPNKTFATSVYDSYNPKTGKTTPVNRNVGALSFDPATGTYSRTSALANLGKTGQYQESDKFTNVFDYLLGGKLAEGDTSVMGGGQAGTANLNALSSLFSNTSQNRLENSLTQAYRNLTGQTDAILPADVTARYTPQTYGYYSDPSKYDTDYSTALQDLMGRDVIKGFVDPQYQYALGKIGFQDTDASKKNFYDAASKYGLSNVVGDVNTWQPVGTKTGTDTGTSAGGTGTGNIGTAGSPNTVDDGMTGPGATGTGNTSQPYGFDPSMFPTRTANQGFREGSRYFNEGSGGQYSNQYPNLGNMFQTTSGSV